MMLERADKSTILAGIAPSTGSNNLNRPHLTIASHLWQTVRPSPPAMREVFAHSSMIGKSTPTDRVTLRPFGREDFSRLISWLPTEADLIEWCAAFFQYPLTDAQLERYLESSRQPNSRVVFTARSPGAEAVGHIEISQIWPHLSTRLSRVLVAPDQRRRGFASSMVAQALSVSFDQYFVDRVDVGVSATNSAATGCYAKLGFKPVGKWPNAIVAGSSTLDVIWMTVTRDTWSQLRP